MKKLLQRKNDQITEYCNKVEHLEKTVGELEWKNGNVKVNHERSEWENRKLRQEMAENRKPKIENVNSNLEVLERQLKRENIERQLKMEDAERQLKMEKGKLKVKIGNLKNENGKLRATNQTLENENGKLTVKNGNIENKNGKLNTKIEDLEVENRNLARNLYSENGKYHLMYKQLKLEQLIGSKKIKSQMANYEQLQNDHKEATYSKSILQAKYDKLIGEANDLRGKCVR